MLELPICPECKNPLENVEIRRGGIFRSWTQLKYDPEADAYDEGKTTREFDTGDYVLVCSICDKDLDDIADQFVEDRIP